ncbi:hypothetical protein HNP03_002852 [Pseudomonas rhodesiae]|nr:hypothetical protein [Pseudomonas rhodesiae]
MKWISICLYAWQALFNRRCVGLLSAAASVLLMAR